MRLTKNNATPVFTDQELLTSYLFSVAFERKLRVKDIYKYMRDHWLDCFPTLPSYAAYNARLNRLAPVFPVLVQRLIDRCESDADNELLISLTDSMPIMTCSGKRQGKVARELCDKGYNSTKKMHFFGLKLHSIGFARPGTLPHIEFLQVSAASEHDLTAQRQILEQMHGRAVLGDKAFSDTGLAVQLQTQGGELLTPVKYRRGQPLEDKQRHKAADDLYSKAVSRLRQPIESLFNWIIEHTDLQRASKVRSTKGLLVHIFGKIAAALIPKARICSI
ncbi:MAG: transposase [Bacteroidota bacterium]